MSQSTSFNTIYLNFSQATIAETTIPFAFTEDDILHYIIIEQAKLFPTLDQEIYFDFLVKNAEEENKNIVIVACNKKDFSALDPTTLFLKIDHPDFENFNLLPWRQNEKKRCQKKRLKTLTIVTISTNVLMLAVSLFYLSQAHQDKKRAIDLSCRKNLIFSQLNALEKSNQEIKMLSELWRKKINNAHNQSNLEAALIMIDIQRPENTVLNKITWKENKLLLKGRSKENSMVKIYLKNLAENKINAQLKFMGNILDKAFPVQFEIEIIGEEK